MFDTLDYHLIASRIEVLACHFDSMLCSVLFYHLFFKYIVTRATIGRENLTVLYLNWGGSLIKKMGIKIIRLGERRAAYGNLVAILILFDNFNICCCRVMLVWQIIDDRVGYWQWTLKNYISTSTDGPCSRNGHTYIYPLVILAQYSASGYCS